MFRRGNEPFRIIFYLTRNASECHAGSICFFAFQTKSRCFSMTLEDWGSKTEGFLCLFTSSV